MLLYIVIILVSVAVISVANTLCMGFEWSTLLWSLLNVSLGAIAAIAIDGVAALIARRVFPEAWFLPERRAFVVSKTEKNFYGRLKIKAWKDHIPELGVFTGFSKSELKSTSDAAYLKRFILEINYGVMGHIAGGILGLLLCFLPAFYGDGVFVFPSPASIWIPVFVVNLILSLLPTFVLRYTSYTLVRLYNKQLKRENNACVNASVDTNVDTSADANADTCENTSESMCEHAQDTTKK